MTPALSSRLRLSLENLSRKSAGEEVGWINIADAIALTDAGLCRRTAEGWKITSEGQTLLAAQLPPSAPEQSGAIPMSANDSKLTPTFKGAS